MYFAEPTKPKPKSTKPTEPSTTEFTVTQDTTEDYPLTTLPSDNGKDNKWQV